MNLPKNGRVVVIDDESKEALPLVNVLSKNGISVSYFTGKQEDLPAKPLTGIRIVFLDIILGTDGQNDKTKISTAIGVLNRLIDQSEHSPYILIAWTKHEELISKIRDGLKANPPVVTLNLRKNQCKYRAGGYNLGRISSRIREELKKVKSLHLFVLWENVVHKSAGRIVDNFVSFYPLNADWDKNMQAVLYALAKAYSGKNLKISDRMEICSNALLTFNSAFRDTLENNIKSSRELRDIPINNSSAIPDPAIRASINTQLLLSQNGFSEKPMPGNLYRNNIAGIKRVNLKELFEGNFDSYAKKTELMSSVRHIALEVSPVCDHACKKLRMNRLLPGVMWPIFMDKIKKSDYTYTTPIFSVNGKSYKFVFDLRYLASVSPNVIKKSKQPLLKVRHELLVDIQSYIARHINRPGIISI